LHLSAKKKNHSSLVELGKFPAQRRLLSDSNKPPKHVLDLATNLFWQQNANNNIWRGVYTILAGSTEFEFKIPAGHAIRHTYMSIVVHTSFDGIWRGGPDDLGGVDIDVMLWRPGALIKHLLGKLYDVLTLAVLYEVQRL